MERLPVGKVIQRLRKAKGITQEQLGEILSVSSAAISKWENEQMYPDISFFPVLARYFNVSIDCLFGFSNELSEDEYVKYKSECIKLFEDRQYFLGVEKIKAISYLYPTNDKVKIDLSICILPYLALANDGQVQREAAAQIISICESCTDLHIQSKKHFVLAHLYMLIGEYQQAVLNTNTTIPQKDIVSIDMTNSLLLRANNFEAIEKIDSALATISIQLLFELRNKASHLQKTGDFQAALVIMWKQCSVVELLELDRSLYFMLYLNIAYTYCLLGQVDHAKKVIAKFISLFQEIPIMDSVLFQILKTGFKSDIFDIVKNEPEFRELESLLS